MLLLIDGYNVIAPVAAPARGANSRWLDAERRQLIERLAAKLPAEVARQTTVIFDAAAAPAGAESKFTLHGIAVQFAIGYPEADDLIEELIAAHHVPKRLLVVSSDHRLQAAAKRRNAVSMDSNTWFDRLLDGHVILASAAMKPAPTAALCSEKPTAPEDIAEWLEAFGLVEEESSADPRPPVDHPFPPGYGEDLL